MQAMTFVAEVLPTIVDDCQICCRRDESSCSWAAAWHSASTVSNLLATAKQQIVSTQPKQQHQHPRRTRHIILAINAGLKSLLSASALLQLNLRFGQYMRSGWTQKHCWLRCCLQRTQCTQRQWQALWVMQSFYVQLCSLLLFSHTCAQLMAPVQKAVQLSGSLLQLHWRWWHWLPLPKRSASPQ